jgi:acetyltransferase-like isoleucine patch superfamily enzyme
LLPQFLRSPIFFLLLNRIGKGCIIDYDVYLRYPKKISIGNNVSINRGTIILPGIMASGATVTIGNNVAVGPCVKILAASHDYNTLQRKDIGFPVIVHDDVWIGAGAIILPGVILGEGAVVGAGSVVTKNVPPYTVVAGNPARKISSRSVG